MSTLQPSDRPHDPRDIEALLHFLEGLTAGLLSRVDDLEARLKRIESLIKGVKER